MKKIESYAFFALIFTANSVSAQLISNPPIDKVANCIEISQNLVELAKKANSNDASDKFSKFSDVTLKASNIYYGESNFARAQLASKKIDNSVTLENMKEKFEDCPGLLTTLYDNLKKIQQSQDVAKNLESQPDRKNTLPAGAPIYLAEVPKELSDFKSKLPKCQGEDYREWNNCVGAVEIPVDNMFAPKNTYQAGKYWAYYYGEWKNGEPGPRGAKLHPYHKTIYKGGFKNWLENGQGEVHQTSGDSYIGGFLDGEYHGKGVKIINGKKYTTEHDNQILIGGSLKKEQDEKRAAEEENKIAKDGIEIIYSISSDRRKEICKNITKANNEIAGVFRYNFLGGKAYVFHQIANNSGWSFSIREGRSVMEGYDSCIIDIAISGYFEGSSYSGVYSCKVYRVDRDSINKRKYSVRNIADGCVLHPL